MSKNYHSWQCDGYLIFVVKPDLFDKVDTMLCIDHSETVKHLLGNPDDCEYMASLGFDVDDVEFDYFKIIKDSKAVAVFDALGSGDYLMRRVLAMLMINQATERVLACYSTDTDDDYIDGFITGIVRSAEISMIPLIREKCQHLAVNNQNLGLLRFMLPMKLKKKESDPERFSGAVSTVFIIVGGWSGVDPLTKTIISAVAISHSHLSFKVKNLEDLHDCHDERPHYRMKNINLNKSGNRRGMCRPRGSWTPKTKQHRHELLSITLPPDCIDYVERHGNKSGYIAQLIRDDKKRRESE